MQLIKPQKYTKQKNQHNYKNYYTIRIWDFNTFLMIIDQAEKYDKDLDNWNNTINNND